MKSIGSLLIVFGIAAIIFGFMEKVPKLLVWIYNWGEGAAWAIKIGFVVVGAIFLIMGSKRQSTNNAGQ